MSTCHIIGFFCLARGSREKVTKRGRDGDSSSATWYAHYDTTITCIKETFVAADLRIYSPFNDVIHPDNSIAFVIGKAFVQTGAQRTLIDAFHLDVVPGDVSSPEYQDCVPSFINSYVFGVGHVCAEQQMLEDHSRAFPVMVAEYVRDETKHFQLMCLFTAGKPRWNNTKIPSVGTAIQFNGVCSRILPSGIMAIDLDSLTFNLGSQPPPSVQVSTESSKSTKKRKFNAYPPNFQQSVPAAVAAVVPSSNSAGGQSSSSPTLSSNVCEEEEEDEALRIPQQTSSRTRSTRQK